MPLPAVPRRLRQLYTFFGRTFCWQCSFCGKQFMITPVAEFFREDGRSEAIPDEVRSAFDSHDCRWILFAEHRPA